MVKKSIWIPSILLVLMGLVGSVSAETSLPDLLMGQATSARRAGMQVYDSDRGKQLLGEVIETDFPRLLPGWNEEYDSYEPSLEDVATLAEIKEDIVIICILGTWCHDSEREVPRLWKILREADNPRLELAMFGVGRNSDDRARKILAGIGFDESLRDTYDVELVPTFIFMSGEAELGRIIESPETTLEQDAVKILIKDKAGKPAWQ